MRPVQRVPRVPLRWLLRRRPHMHRPGCIGLQGASQASVGKCSRSWGVILRSSGASKACGKLACGSMLPVPTAALPPLEHRLPALSRRRGALGGCSEQQRHQPHMPQGSDVEAPLLGAQQLFCAALNSAALRPEPAAPLQLISCSLRMHVRLAGVSQLRLAESTSQAWGPQRAPA